MGKVNSYSYFLMDKALNEMIKESVDYEWDFVNNKEIDHRNKTVIWLEKSLEKSSNPSEWYKRLLNKISNFKSNIKNYLLSALIPLLLINLSIDKIQDINNGIKDIETKKMAISILEDKLEKSNLEISKLDKTKFVSNKPYSVQTKDEYEKEEKKRKENQYNIITDDNYRIPWKKFLIDIAKRESGNNWKIVNKYGYMGLYQLGESALKDISRKTKDKRLKNIHKRVTEEKFRENPYIFPPKLQDKAFKELIKINKRYLKKYYKYIGKTINDVEISESGLLAAAHLIGHGGVKRFLRTNGKKDPKDANGTKCSDYMKLFKNYRIKL